MDFVDKLNGLLGLSLVVDEVGGTFVAYEFLDETSFDVAITWSSVDGEVKKIEVVDSEWDPSGDLGNLSLTRRGALSCWPQSPFLWRLTPRGVVLRRDPFKCI